MTADRAGTRSLQCGEVWGGNSAVEQTLGLPGPHGLVALEGLRANARAVSIGPPSEVGAGLLEAVHQFGVGGTQTDDESLIVLRCEA